MIRATIQWESSDDHFPSNRYSRFHTWVFDGGQVIRASSSPDIVPVPMSDASAVDPEEAFVASLSSCHMLWFLSLAAQAGLVVQTYRDEALGEMQRNDLGKPFVGLVTLNPQVTWLGQCEPSREQIADLHHRAHQECFIANSVKTEIRIKVESRSK